MNELTFPAPEWLEVANHYLKCGSIANTADALSLPEHQITEVLARKDVRTYLDNIYLDLGYRNRNKLGQLMDEIIESKLSEAREAGMYSSKDLADLLMMAHKMRMEEIKLTQPNVPTTQTNIQLNGYDKLMEKLLGN